MSERQWDNPPAMQIDPQKTCRVTIETNRGDMELKLYPEYAPKTVNNFVFLAQEGFYDGMHTVFGKLVEGQEIVNAIQQGDRMVKVMVNDDERSKRD